MLCSSCLILTASASAVEASCGAAAADDDDDDDDEEEEDDDDISADAPDGLADSLAPPVTLAGGRTNGGCLAWLPGPGGGAGRATAIGDGWCRPPA